MRIYKILFVFLFLCVIVPSPQVNLDDINTSIVFTNNKDQNGFSIDVGSFFGGQDSDYIRDSGIDYLGNVFLYGVTWSLDFPFTNTNTNTMNHSVPASFLAKISPTGDLIFSLNVGGPLVFVWIQDMEIDPFGNVILVGETQSQDLPTSNAFQDTFAGETDGVVMKFSSNGELLFSTYVGGSSSDSIRQIEVNQSGFIFIIGHTTSLDFPTLDPLNHKFGGETDSIFLKLSPNGTLLYSRFLGGKQEDFVSYIKISDQNEIFLAGMTNSGDFPTINAYERTVSGEDGFLMKFLQNMSVVFSTFVGDLFTDDILGMEINSLSESILIRKSTSGLLNPDQYFLMKFNSTGGVIFNLRFDGISSMYKMRTDSKNNIYVIGTTNSPDFPTINAYDDSLGGSSDGFVIKFSKNGTIVFSSYIGGSSSDFMTDIQIDPKGTIFLSGVTLSTDFPVKNNGDWSFQNRNNIFLMKFSSNMLLESSILIGEAGFYPYQTMRIDPLGFIYLTGVTDSPNFPVKNSFQASLAGKEDIYILKSSFSLGLDEDGMDNYWELFYGLNPRSDDSMDDYDHDGITNYVEYLIGTSPILFDTDGDGMDDGYEYLTGLNPLENDAGNDDDHDLVSNLDEYNAGTNAMNVFSFPLFSINIFYVIGFVLTILAFIILLARLFAYKNEIKAPHFFQIFLVWKGKFVNYKEYHLAKFKGASTKRELEFVLAYQAPSYAIALDIKNGNFLNYEQYLEAKALGASSLEAYDLIIRYDAPDYETAHNIHQGGFPSYKVYKKAIKYGYFTFEDYNKRSQ